MAADSYFEEPRFKRARRPGWRWIEWLAAVAIVGLLIAMFMPAIRTGGRARSRMQCSSNLKNIALALHAYESTYGAFPPARTEDADGRPLHSWRTLILPFVDATDLYETIDLAKPWDDPANAKALQRMPPVYRCPDLDGPPNATTYLAIVGPQACFLPDRGRKLAEITNDHNTTLMVLEAGEESAVPWMAPRDADEALVLGLGPNSRLGHRGGVNAAYVDGSVRFFPDSVSDEVRRALIAISGGEKRAIRAEDFP